MFIDPPQNTKLEITNVQQKDPRKGPTLGKALDHVSSKLTNETAAAVAAVISAHGLDARDWPMESLDNIARLDARCRALDLVAIGARHMNIEFATTPAREIVKP